MTKDELLRRIVNKISQNYPELNLTAGSPFYKLVIEPVVDALMDIIGDIEQVQNILSGSVTGDLLDRCAETFFITRRSAVKATGYVRVYFYTPVSVSIKAGREFTALNGSRYNSTCDIVTDALTMSDYQEYGLYYVDVPVEGDSDCEAHTIVTMEAPHPAEFAHVDNPEPISGSRSEETDAEFLNRIKDSYGLRSVMTVAGLKSIVMEAFDNIVDAVVISSHRVPSNINLGASGFVPIPTYGVVDIYVRTVPTTVSQDYTVGDNHAFNIDTTQTPLLWIDKVVEVSGNIETEEYTDYVAYCSSSPATRYSSQETISIKHDSWQTGDIIRVYGQTCSINAIQNFVNTHTTRLIGVDALVKAAPFVKVYLNLNYLGSPTITEIQDHLTTQIENLALGTVLDKSDIINWLYNIGCDYVKINNFSVGRFYRSPTISVVDQRCKIEPYEYYKIGNITVVRGE